MKHLKEKHEACIRTIDLIIEGQRIVDEMIWSNGRNNEQGLTPYHTEENIQAEIRAINRLKARYTLLTAKL
jgi:hypothetical protein